MKRFRLLMLGDVHFGENYLQGRAQVAERGYLGGLEALQRFRDSADAFVVNLETPIVDPAESSSPFEGAKQYIHWSHPDAVEALVSLGVDAVSLANNHTLDFGSEGLLASLHHLDQAGIKAFGAGPDIDRAREPWVLSLPRHVGGGSVVVHGGFEYRAAYDETWGFYADVDRPGCLPFSAEGMQAGSLRDQHPAGFHIVFPHWGANYRWRNTRQRDLAQAFAHAGADLVVGHGSHLLQQVERRQGKWIVYSLGNGHFQSQGRFAQFMAEHGVVPMSFWAMVDVVRTRGRRSVEARLYPVYSDNTQTGFTPTPVSEADFMSAVQAVREHTRNARMFDNSDMSLDQDDLGFCIRLAVGRWP